MARSHVDLALLGSAVKLVSRGCEACVRVEAVPGFWAIARLCAKCQLLLRAG